MTELLVAIAAFLLAHVVPPAPPVRARLIGWLGRRVYLGAYSLMSVALIAWIVAAAYRAPNLPLWDPAPWQGLVPMAVMPLATWLLLAGLTEPNPLSISFLAARPEAEPGPAASVTRHPVLWAFLLWALCHIPPNGDVVSLILFGGAALLAGGGLAALDRRMRRRLGEERWRTLARCTSIVPFAAILAGRARIRMSGRLLLTVAAAAAAYAWFLLDGHARLIGLDPLAWLPS
jgi:uncharacterized membrane protein